MKSLFLRCFNACGQWRLNHPWELPEGLHTASPRIMILRAWKDGDDNGRQGNCLRWRAFASQGNCLSKPKGMQWGSGWVLTNSLCCLTFPFFKKPEISLIMGTFLIFKLATKPPPPPLKISLKRSNTRCLWALFGPLVIWVGYDAKCFPSIILFSPQRQKDGCHYDPHCIYEDTEVCRACSLSKAQ